MRNVVFAGNIKSQHIKTWFKLYEKGLNLNVDQFYTIHPIDDVNLKIKRIFLFGKIFSYLLLGLYFRIFLDKKKTVIHAHGASGYGLAAALSGCDYVVTVYGSEVFGLHSRLYSLMMRYIFRSAATITVTTDAAVHVIVAKFGDGQYINKILCFHTGIDFDALDRVRSKLATADSADRSRKFKILSIRNCAPVYQTEKLILAYCQAFPEISLANQLVIFLGNGDLEYFGLLKSRFAERGDIVFINKLLPQNDLIDLICSADLNVSFAATDQLSASIIETIYLGGSIVVSDLPAYGVLKKLFPMWELASCIRFAADQDDLAKLMFDAKANDEKRHSESAESIKCILRDNFSLDSAAAKFASFNIIRVIFEV